MSADTEGLDALLERLTNRQNNVATQTDALCDEAAAAIRELREELRQRESFSRVMTDQCFDLKAERDSLRTQLSAAQRDAERYRKLKTLRWAVYVKTGPCSWGWLDSIFGQSLDAGLDDTPDAALSRKDEAG